MFELAVLIAASEAQPALTAHLSGEVQKLLVFDESAALPALQAITSRKPALVVLERGFADTPRGKALINRVKADPALKAVTLRQVSTDDAELAVIAQAPDEPVTSEDAPTAPPSSALDFSGTRRSERFAIRESTEMLVDGKPGVLVNLSQVGAQLVTSTALKPTQRVRISLSDDAGSIRGTAVVVWATFEMPKNSGPRYRVGLDFINPDTQALEAYIRRHARGRD